MATTQRIYEGEGKQVQRPVPSEDPADIPSVPTIADLVPVTQIMAREITCAHRNLTRDRIVQLMIRNHIGCIPVIDERGHPIGMITKLDLVEQLLQPSCRAKESPSSESLAPLIADELMMPLAITLGERATVAHACAMMASEDVHHVPIVDATGCLIGLVSSMDIVRWLAKNDGFTAER